MLLLAAQTDSTSGSDSDLLEDVLPSGVTAGDWIAAGIVVVVSFAAAQVLRTVLERLLDRAITDTSVAHFLARIASNLVRLGGIIYALGVLGVQLGPLLGALGLGGLAIAFAAQSILENTFSSIVLRTRRPFRPGDQIRSEGIEGVAEEITWRVVVVRTYDGERVEIPSSVVLRNAIVNESAYGRVRTTVVVGVAYGTPLPLARDTLLGAVRSVSGVRAEPAPEVWAQEFSDSSIDFAVRFWHEPVNRVMWRVRSDVVLAIKAALDDAGITIPFPQRTLGWLDDAEPEAAAG